MKTISILVDGKIPAHTVCPYTQKCDPNREFCNHAGAFHHVPYSCGSARGFEILNREIKMSKSVLNAFCIGDAWYSHYIDTSNDATYIENEAGEILYTVDSDARVFDRAGNIGKFRTDENHLWCFHGLSGLFIATGNKDLIKAEMKLFKILLNS